MLDVQYTQVITPDGMGCGLTNGLTAGLGIVVALVTGLMLLWRPDCLELELSEWDEERVLASGNNRDTHMGRVIGIFESPSLFKEHRFKPIRLLKIGKI